MDPDRHRPVQSRPRSILRLRRIGAGVLGLVVLATGLAPGSIGAQDPSPSAPTQAADLAGRLPARIADAPVQLDGTEDLGSWIDGAYPGETGPELAALDAALDAQGATRADVRVAWASAFDYEVGITGFQLPDGDASALREAIVGVYFLGFGDLVRTDEAVDGGTVTIVSQGPPDEDDYPYAVVTDRDAVWIASGTRDLLRPTVEALVGAASGTVARYDASATPDPGYAAPFSWDGTVSQTITWDQNSYKGTATGRLTGSWVQPLSTIRYCERDCTAYIPVGTIEWSWDVSAPTRPRCSASTRGSLEAGDVIVPTDQMLFLDPTDDGQVLYWGSGTFFLSDQPCVGWEGSKQPGSFFGIPAPEPQDPYADESTDPYPSCANRQWRIAADATRITGRCWNYRSPGYEDVVEWDLVARDE